MTISQLINYLKLDGVNGENLSEATYFACLKVLSESIGKLPLKIMQSTNNNGIVKAVNHQLYSVVKYRPNPFMTSSHLWSTVEFNRNHYGNAYCYISGTGAKTTIWILPSDQVAVWYDDRLLLSKIPELWYIYTNPKTGQKHKFSSAQILHFKSSCSTDGFMGESVADKLKTTIEGNKKAQGLLNKLYENGFTAKAVVQYTGNLNDENTKLFLKGIEDYATGKDPSSQGIIPIPLGASLQPLNIKLTDAQFMELKKYSALQIASAFGIKPNQINDYEKSSYASAEAQQLAFYVDTLLYIIKQYEEELSYKLLTDDERTMGYHFKFNISVILRADSKTQLESLQKAVQSSIYTPNEAREMLDKEKKEGGDELLCNGAMLPLKLAGIQYQKKEGEENIEPIIEIEPQNNVSKEEEKDIKVNLNGAQIDSLITIVELVATGKISFESAKKILTTAFPFDDDVATQILNDGEITDLKEGEEN